MYHLKTQLMQPFSRCFTPDFSGFSTQFESKHSLTNLVNWYNFKFGFPLIAAFSRTYLTASLFMSSFCHNTPLLWYFPCRVSGNEPLLTTKVDLHSRIVRSVLPNILPISVDAVVSWKSNSFTGRQ